MQAKPGKSSSVPEAPARASQKRSRYAAESALRETTTTLAEARTALTAAEAALAAAETALR